MPENWDKPIFVHLTENGFPTVWTVFGKISWFVQSFLKKTSKCYLKYTFYHTAFKICGTLYFLPLFYAQTELWKLRYNVKYSSHPSFLLPASFCFPVSLHNLLASMFRLLYVCIELYILHIFSNWGLKSPYSDHALTFQEMRWYSNFRYR